MKKFFLGAVTLVASLFSADANAQLSKGTWMVGGNVANVRFTNGFAMRLSPQVGYFVTDRFAVGGMLDWQAETVNSELNSNVDLGIFSRYYFSDSADNILDNGRFFLQGKVGFGSVNKTQENGANTNGALLGIGAGYSYFITRSVALEGILDVSGYVGGGNATNNANVNLGVGFQIFLPNSTARAAVRDQQ